MESGKENLMISFSSRIDDENMGFILAFTEIFLCIIKIFRFF